MTFNINTVIGFHKMKTKPEGVSQLMAQWIYSILYECDRSYIGEIGRSIAIWLCQHRQYFKEGLLDKSKGTLHAYEMGHGVNWVEFKILEIES
jgi:hypothetical protein